MCLLLSPLHAQGARLSPLATACLRLSVAHAGTHAFANCLHDSTTHLVCGRLGALSTLRTTLLCNPEEQNARYSCHSAAGRRAGQMKAIILQIPASTTALKPRHQNQKAGSRRDIRDRELMPIWGRGHHGCHWPYGGLKKGRVQLTTVCVLHICEQRHGGMTNETCLRRTK